MTRTAETRTTTNATWNIEMTNQPTDLVFIYKAESGLLNKLKDAVHKTFKPETYPCKLCDITYSPVHMRGQWKRFVKDLPYNVEFSYTDLIEAEHPDAELEYPCAVFRHGSDLKLVISADQMNACDSLDELIALVKTSVK